MQTAGLPGAEQELTAGMLPAATAAAGTPTATQPPGMASSSSMAVGLQSGSAAVLKVRKQLAKVLGRRAAAYVELQQLQEAWDDLQQALRWDE